MIKHVVMWKLKDFAEGASKAENARKMKSQLEGLKKKISQVRLIEVGINTNEVADAYDVVLYSEFENVDDLHLYQKHPEHLKVGDFVGKVRLERRVVDYEA
ncbi:MAG: stress responsive protein [Chloroflexi bacterium RBG_16_56_11]|nr:MAG: stress responsive protein [Chloroflexi bacterium RBG_16_56_11]